MASACSRNEDEIVASALRNTVVLRKILSNLNFNALKNCSLVCKFWKSEVRSYIRDFRRCDGKISRDDAEVYEDLLKKLQIKYFSISIHANFKAHQCPAKKFVRTVLCGKTSAKLRILTFCQVPSEFQYFFDKDWAPCFSKLTTLKFGTLDADHKSISKWIGPQKDFFSKVINGAPNLVHISGYFDPDALEFLPKEKYSLLKEFYVFIKSAKHEKICWELVEARPALSYLVMDTPQPVPTHGTSFFRVLEQLLKSSSSHVEKLTMQFSIFPLNQLSFPPLVSLKTFEIETGATPEQVLSALCPFDYGKVLPTLSQVKICSDPECDSDDTLICPSFSSSASSSVLEPSMTVKKFCLEADVTQMTFQNMSQIFPNVTDLEVSLRVECRIVTPYSDLWASWPRLDNISIIEGRGTLGRNFDTQFLGIHADELEILRELDDESLEKMQIVPIKPSIVSMLLLRSLKIEFERERDFNDELPANQVFLSKIAGILALRKLAKAGTSVQFICRHPIIFSGLHHLLPFASVVLAKH